MDYKNKIIEIYNHKISTDNIKYLGTGSDSIAYQVKKDIVRFPKQKNNYTYYIEQKVCNFIRKKIQIKIPNVKIYNKNKLFYIIHKKIVGNNWSWHKFSITPKKQLNLAKSIALFLHQLHNNINCSLLIKKIPEVKKTIPFITFDNVKKIFSVFCTKHQINILEKNFNKILQHKINSSDFVLTHMGIKCANTVVDNKGNLIGVFDFCNCGIYERWRDFCPLYQSKNPKLYNCVLKYYKKLSGIKINKKRISDLVAIGILWKKRWNNDFTKCTLGGGNTKYLKSEIMNSLGYFYKIPRFLYKVIYFQLSVHEKIYNKKHQFI